jgi:CTP:molybdopterin cytidylyltransferase MocA
VSAGQHAALILAAGFSTRMHKGFKPLLPLPFADGERSALENLARLYAEAGIERIFVVGGQRQGEDVAAEARRLGLVYVQNPDAERGMFSSVRAGLEAVGASGAGCFVHPADIPLVRLYTLRVLLAEAEKHSDVVLVPLFKGEEGHPPLLPAARLPAILAWQGENGLRGALGRLPCRHVPVADKNILLDMDTDGDHAEVCGRAGRFHILEPEEAEEFLRCLAVETRGMAHARAVGLVAKKFALACNAAGVALDPLLAEAGGLLHDMCKGQAQHERAAGEELRRLGLPAMARIVEEHRDCALADDAPVTEREIIYLADKYVYGDRLVSLQERFGRKLELFSGEVGACEAIRGRLARAEAMEQRLRRETGALPFELARDALKEWRETP